MSFEDNISSQLFSGTQEKTFIDKVLAKDDVNAIRSLIKKPRLTREELLEILYLISGSESKLLNYGEWDRYVILKFFVWIREFIKVAELLYDYEDELQKKEEAGKIHLTHRTKKLLDNNSLLIQHNAKFLIDLYLNISRTSMSIGMSGFLELVRNKYELYYPNQQQSTEVQRGGMFGGIFGGKK